MLKKLLAGLLVLLFSVSLASAADVGGLTIPDSIDADGNSLVLNGAGIRKKFGFKVYVGGLYLTAKTSEAQRIIEADEPMAITMTWKRTGPIDKVTGVFAEGFQYGAGSDYDALKADIDTFLGAVVKAKKGDVWKYQYLPGKGLSAYNNGELGETYTDIRFKKAVFAIWLLQSDSFTGDIWLRDGMLGK